MTSILIAEDEARIARFVEKGLRAAGYRTTVAERGDDALALATSEDFDLVLLDVGLPGIDGFTVLRRLRATGVSTPVVMLTARGSTEDMVRGLDDGASDYVTKPFRFDELLARVRARVRESGAPGGGDPTTLAHGGVVLDLRTRRAEVDGAYVELSTREFELAETFLRSPDQVLSREQLLSRVWGYDFDPGSNVVDVYVRYLRAKLGSDRIQTVRGSGYRFTG
ncbi:response regulator transcription factor [Microbacterium marinilacus]|uniref:Response regulator transcription factor n=1 Tax=Microbacterium marinilacus TaxID=415209 RepID=A0ABP7BAP2_9MICO|nr:response regulator transcription factor [Microbacterium marinilacus]MBY0687153.1 response regulator transcription factor [Microbacterium marinilacus]